MSEQNDGIDWFSLEKATFKHLLPPNMASRRSPKPCRNGSACTVENCRYSHFDTGMRSVTINNFPLQAVNSTPRQPDAVDAPQPVTPSSEDVPSLKLPPKRSRPHGHGAKSSRTHTTTPQYSPDSGRGPVEEASSHKQSHGSDAAVVNKGRRKGRGGLRKNQRQAPFSKESAMDQGEPTTSDPPPADAVDQRDNGETLPRNQQSQTSGVKQDHQDKKPRMGRKQKNHQQVENPIPSIFEAGEPPRENFQPKGASGPRRPQKKHSKGRKTKAPQDQQQQLDGQETTASTQQNPDCGNVQRQREQEPQPSLEEVPSTQPRRDVPHRGSFKPNVKRRSQHGERDESGRGGAPSGKPKKDWRASIPCRFGNRCSRSDCAYRHSSVNGVAAESLVADMATSLVPSCVIAPKPPETALKGVSSQANASGHVASLALEPAVSKHVQKQAASKQSDTADSSPPAEASNAGREVAGRKKKCWYGSKCRTRNCPFSHPTRAPPRSAGAEKAVVEVEQEEAPPTDKALLTNEVHNEAVTSESVRQDVPTENLQARADGQPENAKKSNKQQEKSVVDAADYKVGVKVAPQEKCRLPSQDSETPSQGSGPQLPTALPKQQTHALSNGDTNEIVETVVQLEGMNSIFAFADHEEEKKDVDIDESAKEIHAGREAEPQDEDRALYKAQRKAAKKERRRREREEKEAAAATLRDEETRVDSAVQHKSSGSDDSFDADKENIAEACQEPAKPKVVDCADSRGAPSRKDQKKARYERKIADLERQKKERAEGWQEAISEEVRIVGLIADFCLAEFVRSTGLIVDRKVLRDSKDTKEKLVVVCSNAFRLLYPDKTSTRVITRGLPSKQHDMNNRPGTIRYWDAARGKFFVGLDTKKGGRNASGQFFSPENLEVAAKSKQKGKGRRNDPVAVVEVLEFFGSHHLQVDLYKSEIAQLADAPSADEFLDALMTQRTEAEKRQKEEEEYFKAQEAQGRRRREEYLRREQEQYDQRRREYEEFKKARYEESKQRAQEHREFYYGNQARHEGGRRFHQTNCSCFRCHMDKIFESFFFSNGYCDDGEDDFYDDDGAFDNDDEWDRRWNRMEQGKTQQKRKEAAELLGVDVNASETELKRVYRRQALTYHPDRFRPEDHPDGFTKAHAEDHMRDINNAYDLLMSRFDNQ